MQKITLVLSVATVFLLSCGNGKSTKGTKGNWTQEERTEYMANCISSAKKSYESRGQQADTATVKTICKCSGEMIEAKYAPDEANKVNPEEIKAIVVEAAQKCLTKQ